MRRIFRRWYLWDLLTGGLLLITVFGLLSGGVNKTVYLSSLKAQTAPQEALLPQVVDLRDSLAAYRALESELPHLTHLLTFNRGQCHLLLDSTDRARKLLKNIARRLPDTLKTVAFNNLGVLYARDSQREAALLQFRYALKAHPGNEAARYNYELLKKQIRERQPPPPVAKVPHQAPPQKGPFVPAEKSAREDWVPLSPAEAEARYQQLKKRKILHVQQLQKSLSRPQVEDRPW